MKGKCARWRSGRGRRKRYFRIEARRNKDVRGRCGAGTRCVFKIVNRAGLSLRQNVAWGVCKSWQSWLSWRMPGFNFEVQRHVRDQAIVLLSSHFALVRRLLGQFRTYSSTRTGFEFTGLTKGLKRARPTPTCVTISDMVRGLIHARSSPKSGENPGTGSKAGHVIAYTVLGMMSQSFLIAHLLCCTEYAVRSMEYGCTIRSEDRQPQRSHITRTIVIRFLYADLCSFFMVISPRLYT